MKVSALTDRRVRELVEVHERALAAALEVVFQHEDAVSVGKFEIELKVDVKVKELK